MVLSEQARRNWRLAAVYGSIAVGIQSVLYADYNLPTDDKHVFTDMQLAYRNWLNRASNGVFYGEQQQGSNTINPSITSSVEPDALKVSLQQQQGKSSICSTAPPRGS